LFFSSSSLIITENEFFSALNALQSKEHKLYDTLLYIFFLDYDGKCMCFIQQKRKKKINLRECMHFVRADKQHF